MTKIIRITDLILQSTQTGCKAWIQMVQEDQEVLEVQVVIQEVTQEDNHHHNKEEEMCL